MEVTNVETRRVIAFSQSSARSQGKRAVRTGWKIFDCKVPPAAISGAEGVGEGLAPCKAERRRTILCCCVAEPMGVEQEEERFRTKHSSLKKPGMQSLERSSRELHEVSARVPGSNGLTTVLDDAC